MKYSDILPSLIECGEVVANYLNKHISDDQIDAYLELFRTSSYGGALNRVTEEDGHSEEVFFSLESLYYITGLVYKAEESPEKEADSDFMAAFFCLRAGMIVGAVADNKNQEGMVILSKRGKPFAEQAGRKEDDFTKYLESIVSKHHQKHSKFPSNRKVIEFLKSQIGKGYIDDADDEGGVAWKNGAIATVTLNNKLSAIRKKIKSR